MPDAKQNEACAGCASLKLMVRQLSALVDMQDLPRGFTVDNYRRLLANKPLRLKKPVKAVRPSRRKKRLAF